MGKSTAVLLIDDHPVATEALASRIAGVSDLMLSGISTTVEDAEHAFADQDPDRPIDVVVCDVQLAGRAEGLDLLAHHGGDGGPRFLMLSSFDQPAFVRRAFELGAAGYLPKSTPIETILDAVRAIAAGGTAYPEASRRAMDAALRPPSERELAVIRAVAEGLSNDEIGTRLNLSTKTIESHLHRLYDRYGVLTRTELVVAAIRQGWLTADGAREP